MHIDKENKSNIKTIFIIGITLSVFVFAGIFYLISCKMDHFVAANTSAVANIGGDLFNVGLKFKGDIDVYAFMSIRQRQYLLLGKADTKSLQVFIRAASLNKEVDENLTTGQDFQKRYEHVLNGKNLELRFEPSDANVRFFGEFERFQKIVILHNTKTSETAIFIMTK